MPGITYMIGTSSGLRRSDTFDLSSSTGTWRWLEKVMGSHRKRMRTPSNMMMPCRRIRPIATMTSRWSARLRELSFWLAASMCQVAVDGNRLALEFRGSLSSNPLVTRARASLNRNLSWPCHGSAQSNRKSLKMRKVIHAPSIPFAGTHQMQKS